MKAKNRAYWSFHAFRESSSFTATAIGPSAAVSRFLIDLGTGPRDLPTVAGQFPFDVDRRPAFS
jgi:hypothetical protein